MATYAYKARDGSGKLVKGIMNADDEMDLSMRLKRIGYLLTYAKPTVFRAKETFSTKSKFGKLSSTELLVFTTQLAISLESGVTLLTSLRDLSENIPEKKIRAIIEDISRHVESGRSLKDSLLEHANSFPKLYTSIVGAGESTGKLHLVLTDLANLLEWQQDLQSKIMEASIYPIVLFTAMTGVVILLVTVVIPKFEPMFKGLGTSLPLPTMIIMSMSTLFRNYWWAMLGVVVFAVVGVNILNSKEKGKRQVDKFLLKLPVLGELINKVALSRFCHTFALALRSGVNVFSALGIASEVTGNSYIESMIVKARDYVNVGEKISTALQLSGKFPHLVIRMINVGEQTGTLSDTLEKVNKYYDKEVPATIRKMFAFLEPAMIITMGVVVGGIAASVFLPLTKVISSID